MGRERERERGGGGGRGRLMVCETNKMDYFTDQQASS